MPPARTRWTTQSVTIVGPGRVGQALGRLLAQAGITIRHVAARSLSAARKAVLFIGTGQPASLSDPVLAEAKIVLITTSDAAIGSVARSLALLRKDWHGRVILHTCGSLPATGPASPLAPFKRRGAATGMLHPYQAVPNPAAGVRSLPGSFWGIEGDLVARRVAAQWVKALDGVAVPIRSGRKTLYHAAAFLVGPSEVTLMGWAVRLLRLAGIPGKVARPMLASFVGQTLKNFALFGARRALTGPAPRGDWRTFQRHLAALRRDAPDVIPLYKELAKAMLRLADRRPPQGLF